MNEKYFENACKVGDLYLEKVFMKFEDENILFICKDVKGNRYLCVCYEMRYVLKWIMCAVGRETILQMLIGNITVRECFEKSGKELLHIVYTEEAGEVSCWTNISEIEERILPDKDFRLKYDITRDAYHLNICYEMFAEFGKTESVLKVDAAPGFAEMYEAKVSVASRMNYIIHKKTSYSVKQQSADKEWINCCA